MKPLYPPRRMEINKITDRYLNEEFYICSLEVGDKATALEIIHDSLNMIGRAPMILGTEPNIVLAFISDEFPEELDK